MRSRILFILLMVDHHPVEMSEPVNEDVYGFEVIIISVSISNLGLRVLDSRFSIATASGSALFRGLGPLRAAEQSGSFSPLGVTILRHCQNSVLESFL